MQIKKGEQKNTALEFTYKFLFFNRPFSYDHFESKFLSLNAKHTPWVESHSNIFNQKI